ncbi:MAG: glucose-6-phosphate dehydrogenase [Myxococcota bacterium]
MEKTFDLVIFGGTGDLSCRKLIPALYNGFQANLISPESRIFLTSRRPLEVDVRAWLATVLDRFPPACGVTPGGIDAFAKLVKDVLVELNQPSPGWQELAGHLLPASDRPLVHFLAIPPKLFASTCVLLGQHGLSHEHARVVVEKPLGHDRESADAINREIGEHFSEAQTFRIDHYLGKEAVQNLLALRFSNFVFEKLWNASCVDHIQITIAEQVGLHGRGGFYEGVGATRDMVQNHLLQLLCLVAMEPPALLDAGSIREEKLKVLRCLEPLEGEAIERRVVRGQYEDGAVDGTAVTGYTDDLQIRESQTETFVALEARIENWRWSGVPFYLRTGKRLPRRFAEIVIQFKTLPQSFQDAWAGRVAPNRFVISLQPDDRLAMRLMVNDHTRERDHLREVELNLDLTYGENVPRRGPYLRLILDAVDNDQRLFVHRDEVDLAWAWVDRIIQHWNASAEPPLVYAAGTWGPYEAHDLIKRSGRTWSNGLGPINGGSH